MSGSISEVNSGNTPASQNNIDGLVCWSTGLSGAGKSTLANELVSRMNTQGQQVVLLDGDELRSVFDAVANNEDNHSRRGRLELALQYGRLCQLLSRQGIMVVIATISLFREVHEWNRKNLANYFEVFLDVPVEELRKRDPKGIYRQFEAGLLRNVAGLDLDVDKPTDSDWAVEFNAHRNVNELSDELVKKLILRGKI